MNWKFWQRAANGNGGEPKKKKLPGPKELPQQIGQVLVVQEKMDPDYVWNLKVVLRPRNDNPSATDFRVYSPSKANQASIRVDNYDSLENRPELILFHGWYDKGRMVLEDGGK